MLMEQLKSLQQIINEEGVKAQKYSEIIQVLQKYLKLTKSARTAANNSTFLNSDSFEINTDKSQYNESVLSFSTQQKLSSLESEPKPSKQIAEEAVAESEVILIQNEKYNTEKYNTKNTTHIYKEKLN